MDTATCTQCFADNPSRLYFKQDTEEIIGCSDCAEFAEYGDTQYRRLSEANPVE